MRVPGRVCELEKAKSASLCTMAYIDNQGFEGRVAACDFLLVSAPSVGPVVRMLLARGPRSHAQVAISICLPAAWIPAFLKDATCVSGVEI